MAVSPEQEREIAETERPKVMAQFGGEYIDQAWKDYVTGIVQKLAQASARPDISYTVTILNSPVVNAFALPAGYVFATRGLLALVENEAELAGVLAHEIGHVTARHTTQRYGRSVVVGGGTQILGWLTGSTSLRGLARPRGMLWIQGFSREQEFQADELGVATMARAGYDPRAMASVPGEARSSRTRCRRRSPAESRAKATSSTSSPPIRAPPSASSARFSRPGFRA